MRDKASVQNFYKMVAIATKLKIVPKIYIFFEGQGGRRPPPDFLYSIGPKTAPKMYKILLQDHLVGDEHVNSSRPMPED